MGRNLFFESFTFHPMKLDFGAVRDLLFRSGEKESKAPAKGDAQAPAWDAVSLGHPVLLVAAAAKDIGLI